MKISKNIKIYKKLLRNKIYASARCRYSSKLDANFIFSKPIKRKNAIKDLMAFENGNVTRTFQYRMEINKYKRR